MCKQYPRYSENETGTVTCKQYLLIIGIGIMGNHVHGEDNADENILYLDYMRL